MKKERDISLTKECYQIILFLDLIFFAEGSLNILQDFKTLFWANIPIFSNEKSENFTNFANNQAHWVAISTYNCKNGEVNYYDSLFSGKQMIL